MEDQSLDAVVSDGRTGPPGTTFNSGAKISSSEIRGSGPLAATSLVWFSVVLLLILIVNTGGPTGRAAL